MQTPPKDPQGGPTTDPSATTTAAGTYPNTPKPPERPGRTEYAVLDKSGRGWVGHGKAVSSDADTMKQVDHVLSLLRRGRF